VTANDTSTSNIKVGVENSHKQEGTDFFYGAALNMYTAEDKMTSVSTDDTKQTKNTMPVWFGIEAEAASWLVFRGAITQNFFLVSSDKNTTGGTGEADTVAHGTVVSGGAGMKWGKWNFDGVLKAATDASGEFGLDGNKFLSSASLTYMF
jgi:hypothetical protein